MDYIEDSIQAQEEHNVRSNVLHVIEFGDHV